MAKLGFTASEIASKKYVDDAIANAGGGVTVDQTYNAESENAQSGIAVAQAVSSRVPKKSANPGAPFPSVIATNNVGYDEYGIPTDDSYMCIDAIGAELGKDVNNNDAFIDSIPRRDSKGNLFTGTPVDDEDCVNKKYVDDKIPDNIKNSTGSSSLQQVQDSGYTGIAIKTKNPNAYALDNTLTDNEPIGATGAFSSSFGGASSAQGKRSLAEGTNTVAKGKYSHAEGDNSVALGNDSHAEGLNCVSFGSGSHSEGGSTQAIGMHAHSEGVNTIAKGDASHAGGSGSIANGTHSFAHGNNVIAAYDNQFVVGRFNNNRSDSIFEVGLGSDNTNRTTCFYISQNNGAAYSNFSNGYSPILDPNRYATQSEVSQAITTEVPVIGGNATRNSVVLREGQSSALYDGCVALGVQTTANGTASAAFNSNTQATGNDSCAIGRQTIATGIASHSQGYATQAKGDNSHSEGDNTIAEGLNSHAEGISSYAKGAHSHAQGNNTQALADNSSAAGNRTVARYANQFVVGKFNNNKSDTYFEVGSGADNSNRSNAFEVYTDGHAEIQTMGSTDKSVTTKKYVDDKISAIPGGSGGETWEVISDTTTEFNTPVSQIVINQDTNGNSFSLKKMKVFIDFTVSETYSGIARALTASSGLMYITSQSFSAGTVYGYFIDSEVLPMVNNCCQIISHFNDNRMSENGNNFDFEYNSGVVDYGIRSEKMTVTALGYNVSSISNFDFRLGSDGKINKARILIFGVRA